MTVTHLIASWSLPDRLLEIGLRKPPILRNAASRRNHHQDGWQHQEECSSHSLACSAQTTGDSSHSQRGRLTACLDDESIADNTEKSDSLTIFINKMRNAKTVWTYFTAKSQPKATSFLTVSLLLLLLTMDSGVRICLRLFIFPRLDVYSPS